MLEVSSDSAEPVKVLLRNIISAQTKGNYNPTVVPRNKSCPQYLEGGKVSTHPETPSQARSGGNYKTSEGNTATGTWKAKWREFTAEVIAKQHFPAKKWLSCP